MRRAPNPPADSLELWGGVECTRNRVGDTFYDQLDLGGHAARLADLQLLASLGLKALRYPVLWERVAPNGPARAQWGWVDERLGYLRELGIQPIVGFVHHGSGPPGTSLLDDDFAERLAEFAFAFADRYPWVQWFTPVNEPLTTARFSCLYGHWYPHRRDDGSFVRSLLVQCSAIAASMRAIRAINPDARLLQTEDAGRVFGSRSLVSQVRFENRRRWLTFDLLDGRVDDRHPLWRYLVDNRGRISELEQLAAAPCRPDVLGLNFYVTSDRLLDDQRWRYPPGLRGGNGRLQYADTEAVRERVACAGSHLRVLREAWRRYRVPVALSEVHLGGHREDQLRWLAQAWRAAQHARDRGIDVRAVTVWSLFGAFGWDTLVTRPTVYESGAFDVRGDGRQAPRPTALATAIHELAFTGRLRNPVATGPGWWRRCRSAAGRHQSTAGRPIVMVGSSGTLGSAFRRICHNRGLSIVALTRSDVDAADPRSVETVLRRHRPWVLINAVGFCDVDAAEFDAARCRRANVDVPLSLARASAALGIPLVTFSSDLVFDGRAKSPYVERSTPSPLNAYGMAKAQAEAGVRALTSNCLIVRTSSFFGPWDVYNFAVRVVRHAEEGREILLPSDVIVSATYVPDLVDTVLDVAIDGGTGTWHLVSSDPLTWHELGVLVASRLGLDTSTVVPTPARRMPWTAARPAFSALTSSRANLLPGFDSCLDRFAALLPAAPVRELAAEASR